MKIKKSKLNEAVENRSNLANIDFMFDDDRARIDVSSDLGAAYLSSKKLRQRTEDVMKDKDKETKDFVEETTTEESRTRFRVPKREATRKMHLSESLFEDVEEKKYSMYQFPHLLADDRKVARTDFNLQIVNRTPGDTIVRGKKEDIEAFADDYLGYELVDDYWLGESLNEDTDRKLFKEFKILVDDRTFEVSHTPQRRDVIVPILKQMYPNSEIKVVPYNHYESGYARKQLERIIADQLKQYGESLNEDTIKTKSGKWVNKGDTGETHGEFKTKKAADEQRKAMFARGFKKESLKEADEEVVVFTQKPDDWSVNFDYWFDIDEIEDNGIVISGNNRMREYGDKNLLDIVKGEYRDDDLWNEEEGYFEDYDIIEELEKITGKKYESNEMRGYSQGDWQDIYYPVEEKDFAEEIENVYMGKYEGFVNEDNEIYIIPHDITWKGNEAIKKFISEESGIPLDKIKLRTFKGYRQVADYDEENESLEEARVGKTKQIKVLQGNYGYGWDDLVEYEMDDMSSKQDYKDYRENEPQYRHRIIYRRVPNPDYKEESLKESTQKDITKDELSRKIGGAVYDAYVREFKKATGIDVEKNVSDEDPFWYKLSKAVKSLNNVLYDYYYKEKKESLKEASTTDEKEIEGEFSSDKKTFIDKNGEKHPVNDNGEVIDDLTEARVKLEDDEDFDDYDMFTFISNLFVKDKKPNQLPLKSIGGFDAQNRELYPSNQDNIVLGTDDESDFIKVKEICDEYKLNYKDKEKGGEHKFYLEIEVPKYKNGYPMDIAEYFESIGIDLDKVMPEWYIKRLEQSVRDAKKAFEDDDEDLEELFNPQLNVNVGDIASGNKLDLGDMGSGLAAIAPMLI